MLMRNPLSSWFASGVFASIGLVMMILGVLFIRSMMVSSLCWAGIFTLSLFGVILLLTGGGLLSSTIAESFRRFWRRP
jgi:hypothetical protein